VIVGARAQSHIAAANGVGADWVLSTADITHQDVEGVHHVNQGSAANGDSAELVRCIAISAIEEEGERHFEKRVDSM
jgi:hypothetical protein